MNKGWIGFDLDATLATYDGWVDEMHIGEPIPRMIEILKDYLNQGQECKIFTARAYNPLTRTDREGDDKIIVNIKNWCLKHCDCVIPVTCIKDYAMIKLYDDRCVQVIPNTGKIVKNLQDDIQGG